MNSQLSPTSVDSDSASNTVTVVGAGIVGLSIALRLQMDGWAVTVVDQNEPMTGCSYGNAGYLSEANIFPPASKDVLRRIPELLLSKTGALVVRPSYVPSLVPWAMGALRTSSSVGVDHVNRSMAALLVGALDSFDDMLAAAAAGNLIDRRGGLVAFKTSSGIAAKETLLPIWNSLGLRAERVSAATVRELEPALAPGLVGGIFFPNAGRCMNPRGLGLRYLEVVVQSGGKFIRDRVTKISSDSLRVSVRLSNGQKLRSSKLVVCTGFESDHLEELLKFRLPLASERGYHLMLPSPGVSLNRPVVFGEPLFAATSMEEGLRLAGTAEFARPTAPAAMERAHMLLPLARSFLPELDGSGAKPWMGVRPTFPDGMPAIGALLTHPNILYAVGHSHNGLTTSAITARCISAVAAGVRAPVELKPFAIERFAR